MDIIIGYESALQFWRLLGPQCLSGYQSRRAATIHAQAVMALGEVPRLAEGNRRPGGCALPVQVIVADTQARVRNSRIVSHTWACLPERSLVDVGEGFFMSTPEFCFLQMASQLTLVELMLLGFELCGNYAVVDYGPAESRDTSLTTTDRLRSFVESAPNARGRARALRAIRYVLDSSASPMESILTLLLVLPNKLGGYGLPEPLLNYQIEVPDGSRKLADDRVEQTNGLVKQAAELSHRNG